MSSIGRPAEHWGGMDGVVNVQMSTCGRVECESASCFRMESNDARNVAGSRNWRSLGVTKRDQMVSDRTVGHARTLTIAPGVFSIGRRREHEATSSVSVAGHMYPVRPKRGCIRDWLSGSVLLLNNPVKFAVRRMSRRITQTTLSPLKSGGSAESITWPTIAKGESKSSPLDVRRTHHAAHHNTEEVC